MEKFIVTNSYHETSVAYDAALQVLYIKIGANSKVYEYKEVTQAMYKKIVEFNNDQKAIGTTIIFLNDKGIFGSEVPATKIEWE